MLTNFFSLNGIPSEVSNKTDFINIVMAEDEIINIIYRPDILKPKKDHPRIKIERKSFTNVSFSKTILKNIDFTSCHFEDCLFIGTKFDNCKFRQCTFQNVNTHEINIKNTYINPESFINNFEKSDIKKSNIAVHLFQQLLNNSRDEEQSDFARISNYYFKTWQGRLSRSKFHHKKPYPITRTEFYMEFLPNYLNRKVFGYGLRLRNFTYTFAVFFCISFITNWINWKDYGMHQKDFAIDSFCPITFDFKANLYYTLDVMTQLVDSQFQPSSDYGMTMLTLQGITGFVLFSFLITVLINRFVK
ncbi:pentapeptide repeat-containing protein [Flavobacterium sp. XS2P24]|uniref:pentapeptide repeat-containing protein n=1 Tax=Flavobacterium sp. XS2P24 TaxID=3041249 RepID=UPI0024A90CF2|nr:pentapeptide repeat-containing protein [Flavobacterium sp. XS2P24]MDI6050056.1 pentapeptide repeat-containing protein [Flavobacterium sp. XS2P24]